MASTAKISMTDGSLERLLSLSSNVHENSLSLKALVPFHQSLCEAILGDSAGCTTSGSEILELNDCSSLEDVIGELCQGEKNSTLCRNVLLSQPARSALISKQQLLALQYLLCLIGHDPYARLSILVLPWLLTELPSRDAEHVVHDAVEGSDDDTPPSLPAMWIELLEAALDAVFLSTETLPQDGMLPIFDSCLQVPSLNSEWHWTVQGRVLIRLQVWLLRQQQAERRDSSATEVLHTLTKLCCIAIEVSMPTKQEMVAWLRPMTNDWLPNWLEHCKDTNDLQQLWQCVWEKFLSAAENDSLSLLSTTSILCTIIPSILEVNLKVPSKRGRLEETIDANKKRVPFHQPIVWDLIHTCLKQGIPRAQREKKTHYTDSLREKQSQILRRRGLYLLRMIIPTASEKKKSRNQPNQEDSLLVIWNKYIQVMETLEMETQQHLIEQVWPTLREVMLACRLDVNVTTTHDDSTPPNTSKTPPVMSWHWALLPIARVLTSYDQPLVRKLAAYRFLKGQAGISLTTIGRAKKDKEEGENMKGKRGNNEKKHIVPTGAPLTILTPGFVVDIVLVSFDSLFGSVGTNLNVDQEIHIDLLPLVASFVSLYYSNLAPEMQRVFLAKIWQDSFLSKCNAKTNVLLWESVADAMAAHHLEIDANMLETVIPSLQNFLTTTSLVRFHAESLLKSFASILGQTYLQEVDPKTILKVLVLFDSIVIQTRRSSETAMAVLTVDSKEYGSNLDDDTNPIHASLQRWLLQIGNTCHKNGGKWISMVASSVAAGFVRGELLTPASRSNEEQLHLWDPISGASKVEREMARAIAYLSTLLGRSTESSITAGELLWPAIHKGIASAPMAIAGTTWAKADVVTRALLLLEEGCRLQVLSGMGNGDLIVDEKSNEMMPPPPNIESMLAISVQFVLHHISFLVVEDPSKSDATGASRSGNAKKVSSTLARLIGQMETLHRSFPSSSAVSNKVDAMLNASIEELQAMASTKKTSTSIDMVRHIAITYAALSCGASLTDSNQLVEACSMFLHMEFCQKPGKRKAEEQMARSVFYFAKWGALSCLLPYLLAGECSNSDTIDSDVIDRFMEDFRKVAFDAVHGIPADAMMAYFQCMKAAARRQLFLEKREDETPAKADAGLVSDTIQAFMAFMEERMSSQDALYVLNEVCVLVFHPTLLLEEYQRLMRDPFEGATPIRDAAFRKLIQLAGKNRPHILKVVLCRITMGWLGEDDDKIDGSLASGLGSIPFRKDIVQLLLHKELKQDISSVNQSVIREDDAHESLELPDGIDESSIGRGYLLMFFSRLPNPDAGLHPKVLTDLTHFIIFNLLDEVTSNEKRKSAMIMLGSDEYVCKIRGWQALCCLSRFVTSDTASKVSDRVFQALAEPVHQQIRYFMEIFTLQCARQHPIVFGRALLQNITRRDLSLQNMTSIMIISGNLVVGRYQLDFFTQYDESAKADAVPLNLLLAGTIPWLGSTQGFSRGIAQLLVHKLIPLVVDNDFPSTSIKENLTLDDSNWFLLSIYRFLEENPEMNRLRKKQSFFFEQYDVDKMCTPEGILSLPVDEGGEALPLHMIDIMKKSQKEAFDEANQKEFPQWRHVEDMLKAVGEYDNQPDLTVDGELVNFQRKIIPLDELNLAMESLRERRQRNAVGRKKQKLVVCASLIEKVPNLGGLARTAEIFAAEKLIIPDVSVCKMDNFQSLSVGAGDWIDIEECKEKDLLKALRSYKSKGYFVVGLEQTSSSVSLAKYQFPDQPILLLLGKEKEGIPVEFLQTVDQCLEIPQLGIIRSLNVHVSGAIAIWEHTRQRQLVNCKEPVNNYN